MPEVKSIGVEGGALGARSFHHFDRHAWKFPTQSINVIPRLVRGIHSSVAAGNTSPRQTRAKLGSVLVDSTDKPWSDGGVGVLGEPTIHRSCLTLRPKKTVEIRHFPAIYLKSNLSGYPHVTSVTGGSY